MRYVITRPYRDSNVGSNLASLAGALLLARTVDRPLIIDWRGMTQLEDVTLNYYSEFFATPAELQGVRIEYAPVPGIDDFDAVGDDRAISLSQARALLVRSSDEPKGDILLQPYHGLDRIHPGPDTARHRLLQSFYRELRATLVIEELVDTWWREHADACFVIGVNVRTGNGHYFGKGGAYKSRVDISVFENQRRFLRTLERGCRKRLRSLPKHLRDDFAIFFATDSRLMSELLSRLPNAITRRVVFPPPGTGDTYSFEGDDHSDHIGVIDTLVDMFLLSRCNALVYNSSLFNQYARCVTGFYGGNEVHLETLFLRNRGRQLARALRRGVR
jgi:nodulation protein Z